MANHMKRGPGDISIAGSSGPMLKRPRGDKFCARLIIPSKVAGSVIGKGGANIQKLRSDNNANVRVPDSPGPERVMTVEADDSDIIVNVIEQSLPLMTEEAVKAGPTASAGLMAAAATSLPSPGGASPVEVRLLIHQSIVGGIIGRAGFKIKEIRDSSGCNIKVYQACAPQSTDRCVAIQGTIDKVIVAFREVFNIISNTEIKGSDIHYDPINFDGYYAHEYGGYGSELDTMYAPQISSSGVGHDGLFDSGYGASFAASYRSCSSVRRGRPQLADLDAPFGQGLSCPAAVFVSSEDEGGAAATGPKEVTQVTIPKDLAGAIIGPGGSRIRRIRSNSRASITIDECLPGASERIITISGSKRQIEMAQYLLQQSVREHGRGGGVGVVGVGGGSGSGSVAHVLGF